MCPLPSGEGESDRGQALAVAGPPRMEAPPRDVSQDRPSVWPTHCGPVRLPTVHPAQAIQLGLPRPGSRSRGCPLPGLDGRDELRECPLPPTTSHSAPDQGSGSNSDSGGPILAEPNLVSSPAGDGHSHPPQNTEQPKDQSETQQSTGASSQSQMALTCLEGVWAERLQKEGFSARVIAQFPLCWAESTRQTYNRQLQRLEEFCDKRGRSLYGIDAVTVAEFLASITDASMRPESAIKNTSAAIAAFCEAAAIPNPLSSFIMSHYKSALIKSGTKAPMAPSKAMPIEPFIQMYEAWPDNASLTLPKLRSKSLALLALVCMLRPSDVSPAAELFNPASRVFQFTTDEIQFNADRMVVQFRRIKNDYQRQGYEVSIPRSSNAACCPVLAMYKYIERTQAMRSGNNKHVFLSLKHPFNGVTVATIARILNEAIKDTGLTGYTAKDFRPTGATLAMKAGIPEATVMKVGRWRSVDVFREHYVHYQTESDYTDRVLGTT